MEENGEFDIDFEIDDTNAMTINMSRENETAGMRVANDDEAAETGVAGGKADTGRS